MREIKFRAWSLTLTKMLEVVNVINGFRHLESNQITTSQLFDEGKPHDLIPMQFTGLHDKNGKEIYEGDVLDYAGLKPLEVKWKESGFHAFMTIGAEPFYFTEEGMNAFAKVIGNIYENPELLK